MVFHIIERFLMELNELFDEIDSYKELENNWDSYGAKPPGVKCCDDAHLVLSLVYRTLARDFQKYQSFKRKVKIETCPSSRGISIQLTILREDKE